MKIIKLSRRALSGAVAALKKGGVVVCPTDTVYGFLADASNKKAVEKIYKIKKRKRSKPLPVFVRDVKIAKQIAEIDAGQERTLRKYWPGKYTFVLKSKSKNQKSKLYGIKKNTVAARVPKYKFLKDLLKKINRPLAQTSVNISGEPPLTKVEDIKTRFAKTRKKLGISLLLIDGGDLKKVKPSKIIDLTTNKEITIRA